MFISLHIESDSTRRTAMALLLAILSFQLKADGLTFNDALTLALREAPVLTANEAQIDAARLTAIPAGELPDPQLALGVDNLPIQGADSFSLSRDFMTMQRVGVMQAFPNLAKLDARVAVATGRVALAEAQTRVVRLQVLQETAVAWIAREAVERQLSRISELEDENRLFERAVRRPVRRRCRDGKRTAGSAPGSRHDRRAPR